MPDLDTVLAWRGKTVVDRDGEKAGTLGALYLDEDDHPAYAGVQTGLFRRRESMVPLEGARVLGDESKSRTPSSRSGRRPTSTST